MNLNPFNTNRSRFDRAGKREKAPNLVSNVYLIIVLSEWAIKQGLQIALDGARHGIKEQEIKIFVLIRMLNDRALSVAWLYPAAKSGAVPSALTTAANWCNIIGCGGMPRTAARAQSA